MNLYTCLLPFPLVLLRPNDPCSPCSGPVTSSNEVFALSCLPRNLIPTAAWHSLNTMLRGVRPRLNRNREQQLVGASNIFAEYRFLDILSTSQKVILMSLSLKHKHYAIKGMVLVIDNNIFEHLKKSFFQLKTDTKGCSDLTSFTLTAPQY